MPDEIPSIYSMRSERVYRAAKRDFDKAQARLRKAQADVDAAEEVMRSAKKDYVLNLEIDGVDFDERQRQIEARRTIL